jgi:hypothetical protein
MPQKILDRKAYGHIPHLMGNYLTVGDRFVLDGVSKIRILEIIYKKELIIV